MNSLIRWHWRSYTETKRRLYQAELNQAPTWTDFLHLEFIKSGNIHKGCVMYATVGHKSVQTKFEAGSGGV